jgi:hypothetical protein
LNWNETSQECSCACRIWNVQNGSRCHGNHDRFWIIYSLRV